MISPNLILQSIELINLYGSPITLGTNAVTDYIDGSIVEVTPPTENIVKAVIESYTSQEISGLINAGDIKILISNEIVPNMDTSVTFNSKAYNIINIEPTFLEGVVVIYQLQVRS